ncbi:hypothetical protein FGU71_11595 [Erythrobacter insulae]|uniref:DUF2059 domain-containing protein n=1 Tax=Erythrobacter insulae TaxID=2584124 RepID=A0A547PE78_9SPHN|nr:hypothetical protein [Erythrobacter insulae]TRD12443.1 hypothetical protein FGU71_11595 [Erythrobacter insulae]
MHWIKTLSLAGAALSLPTVGHAQTADLIACMEGGYSEADQATIDRYVSEFSINDDSLAQALGMALGTRLEECAGPDAEEETVILLAQHRFALLSEKGIEASRPDVVEVVRRIDTLLSNEDRARFMKLFSIMVFGDPETGKQSGLNEEDVDWFSNVIIDEPVNGSIEQSEYIGAYLAARVLRETALEQLAPE